PAAPAPTTIASSIPGGWRGAARAGAATADAEAARKARRLIGFMVGAGLRDPSSQKQPFPLRHRDRAPTCACGRSSLVRRAWRTTMLDAALKALEQLLSPPFRAVLLKSVALALVLLLALGIGLHRLIAWAIGGGGGWLEVTLGANAHGPV